MRLRAFHYIFAACCVLILVGLLSGCVGFDRGGIGYGYSWMDSAGVKVDHDLGVAASDRSSHTIFVYIEGPIDLSAFQKSNLFRLRRVNGQSD
jgi:hypothetical protein